MKIIEYNEKYFDGVCEVVRKSVEKTYSKYYTKEVVDFVLAHHSKENMREQLPKEITLLLSENGKIVGTASLCNNYLLRFFILYEYQNKGFGKILLQELESKLDRNKFKQITLSSSLGAFEFYKKYGYEILEFKKIPLPNDNIMYYFEMIKYL